MNQKSEPRSPKVIAALIAILLAALGISAATATLPPSITLSVSGTGTANNNEKRAMTIAIDIYNTAHSAADTNFVALPKSTAAERRSSYLAVMAEQVNQLHAANVVKYGQAQTLIPMVAGDDMDVIMRSITDRIQSGQTIEQIKALVAP